MPGVDAAEFSDGRSTASCKWWIPFGSCSCTGVNGDIDVFSDTVTDPCATGCVWATAATKVIPFSPATTLSCVVD